MSSIELLDLRARLVILLAWLIADFPSPTTQIEQSTAFDGQVDHLICQSSSFIFSALIIFWKAIITFGGLYASFLVRNAGQDFQESVWIFISSCVVMAGTIPAPYRQPGTHGTAVGPRLTLPR